MTPQRALLALAAVAGLAAGVIYWATAQRVSIAVAALDMPAGHVIGAADLEFRELPPDAIPAGAIREIAAGIGRSAKGPVWKGQLLVRDALASAPADFESGVVIPTGYHAVAIPVDAPHALGGAVMPGSRVDVIAVPASGRAPAGRPTELLVRSALVIDVRGDQGGAFERHPAARSGAGVRERLASVVIAVGPSVEVVIADRIATSTFVLVLAPDVP